MSEIETKEQIEAIELGKIVNAAGLKVKFASIEMSYYCWELGNRLLIVKQQLGKEKFEAWAMRQTASVSFYTQLRCLALAKKYRNKDDIPKDLLLTNGCNAVKPKSLKENNVKLQPKKHHLQFVNRFKSWHNEVKVGKVKLSNSEKIKLRVDCQQLFDFLREEIYEE